MKVVAISDSQQSTMLTPYNKGKAGFDKIPVVPRNLNSGWPLLQVTLLLRAKKNGVDGYEFALSGGDCHYMNLYHATLGELITKITGKMNIVIDNKPIAKKDYSILPLIGGLIYDFSIQHQTIGLTLSSQSVMYGKRSNMILPEEYGSTDSFNELLDDANLLAFLKRKAIDLMDNWRTDTFLTVQEIESSVNEETACFFNNQVYLDLGVVLDKAGNEKIKDYFKDLFKVEEFQALPRPQETLEEVEPIESEKQDKTLKNPPPVIDPEELKKPELRIEPNPSATPSASVLNNASGIESRLQTLEKMKNQNPAIYNLYEKIDDLRNYGKNRKLKTQKSETIQALADKLDEIADTFFVKIASRRPLKEEIKRFQDEFEGWVDAQELIIDHHEALWKPVLLNLSIALTGVGLLLMAGKLMYSSIYEKNATPFFFKNTQSAEKRDEVVDALKDVGDSDFKL